MAAQTEVPSSNTSHVLALRELTDLCNILGIQEPNTRLLEEASKVLDTSVAVNLQGRRQLSFANVLTEFSGATHTRYDHVIGTMTKVFLLTEQLKKNEPPTTITDEEELDVMIAACLHDVAHLPFSHPTERALRSATYANIRGLEHEERICRLLLSRAPLWEDVDSCLRNIGLNDERILGVCWMIAWPYMEKLSLSNPGLYASGKPRRFLGQMISSTFDMDRMDYIVRDAQAIGYGPVTQVTPNLLRLILAYRLVRVLSGNRPGYTDYELCLPKAEVGVACSLLVARLLMYKHVYFLPTLRAVESTYARLVGRLYALKTIPDPVEYLQCRDEDFLDHLADLIDICPCTEAIKKELLDDLHTCRNLPGRYKRLFVVRPEDISHNPDREVFRSNIWNLEFLNQLAENIRKLSGAPLGPTDLLCDGLRIRPEKGGPFWIKDEDDESYLPISHYVNGSNIHGLIEELRLDIYVDKAKGDDSKARIGDAIKQVLNLSTTPREI